mmetsp:Transcript_40456/g.86166  ORF Transcript_40456/g.86166 Transcript_40456/m.86166 type:complete len:289 (+) Transcript_40456:1072-1938(+)
MHFCARKNVRPNARATPSPTSGRAIPAVRSLLTVVSTKAPTWLPISTTTLISPTHRTIFGHSLSLIWKVSVWWTTAPHAPTLRLIPNQHVQGLHGINGRIGRQKHNHFVRLYHRFIRSSDGHLPVIRIHARATVIHLNLRLALALQLANHLAPPPDDLPDDGARDLDLPHHRLPERQVSVLPLFRAQDGYQPPCEVDRGARAPVGDDPRGALGDVLVHVDSATGTGLEIADHLASPADDTADIERGHLALFLDGRLGFDGGGRSRWNARLRWGGRSGHCRSLGLSLPN